MTSGKAIAQAGHAYTQTLLHALKVDAPLAQDYARLEPGTKIALDGGDASRLEAIARKLDARGIPNRLIIDHGHVELPHFDGSPVLTALGVGPIDRATARKLLSSLRLWGQRKGGAP